MVDELLPLGDIRVLDVTAARAGPTCVRQLADWGADVIRVDSPTGVGSGMIEPHTADFQNMHRNKRSVALDLKSDDGRKLFYELVKTADVVVENMRPLVKYKLGIDYDSLKAINSGLVYGSISGFGQSGPYSDRPGVDQIAQGMGGLMSVTGLPGQGPVRVGVPIADLSAGVYLAVGILVALHERNRTGEGRWVRTSLLEAMIAMLDFQAARWTISGEVPRQEGNHHPTHVPMGCFETADGYINIAAATGRMWHQFCEIANLSHLLRDERFLSVSARSANREALNEVVQEQLRKKTTKEWIDLLNDGGVPAGDIYSINEVFADPQVQYLGIEQSITSGALGEIRIIRSALSMEGVPDRIRLAAPEVGEHTREVLVGLGLDESQIADLEMRGVVRQARADLPQR